MEGLGQYVKYAQLLFFDQYFKSFNFFNVK